MLLQELDQIDVGGSLTFDSDLELSHGDGDAGTEPAPEAGDLPEVED